MIVFKLQDFFSCLEVSSSFFSVVFFVSNNSWIGEHLLLHNCNKHRSRLVVVLIMSCNFRIRKSKRKHLSALFRFSRVRKLGQGIIEFSSTDLTLS